MIESPARLRVNSDLIKSIFHSGDQRILENFNNLTFSQEDQPLQSLTAKILPKLVDLDSYDFTVSLKDPIYQNFFGIMGKDLQVTGQATTAEGAFDFEADIESFVVEVKEQQETSEKILEFNKNAKTFVPSDLKLQLGSIRTQ